jgi:hypothetical protein
MDETGHSVGVFLNGQVIDSSATKRTYKKEPAGSRKWILILETISAGGKIIRPLAIFKGRDVQSTWFQCEIPDCQYICSESAYPPLRRKMTRFMIGRLINAKRTLTLDEPIRELTLNLNSQQANPNRKTNNTKKRGVL